MTRFGLSAQGMVLLGTSSSQDDKSLAGFEELAMPLFDSLYNFARWLVRNQSDAEDLVQETYRKALHSFASFRPGTNFRGWIFRILKNSFLSSRSELERKMTVAMESEQEDPVLAAERETPETMLIERSGNRLVRRAIEQLPVHLSRGHLVCDVEETSYQEIAETLSIPIGTVMSRLARARRAIRESLRSTPGAPLSAEAPQRGGGNERGALQKEDKLPLDFSDWRIGKELYSGSES